MWKLLAALGFVGAALVLLTRLRTTADRARFLRRAGLGLTAVFTVIIGAWVAAEAFADPGSWQAAGIVALCLVPLVALSTFAWYRVAWASVILAALTAVVVSLSVWFAADPQAGRAFENDNGPVRAIGVFVLAAPIALLGWRRPRPAGVLLVALGVVPVAASAMGTFEGLGSLAAVCVSPVLSGVLYLLADTSARRVLTPPAAARQQATAQVPGEVASQAQLGLGGQRKARSSGQPSRDRGSSGR